jgi:hypothetical protein
MASQGKFGLALLFRDFSAPQCNALFFSLHIISRLKGLLPLLS